MEFLGCHRESCLFNTICMLKIGSNNSGLSWRHFYQKKGGGNYSTLNIEYRFFFFFFMATELLSIFPPSTDLL